MKRLALLLAALLAAWNLLAAFEHVVYDAVSLNGDWEMAYIPYAMSTHKRNNGLFIESVCGQCATRSFCAE